MTPRVLLCCQPRRVSPSCVGFGLTTQADKLLSPEFQLVIAELISFLPEGRQLCMYSATFPVTVKDFKVWARPSLFSLSSVSCTYLLSGQSDVLYRHAPCACPLPCRDNIPELSVCVCVFVCVLGVALTNTPCLGLIRNGS
jgi:hypothetical protein